MTRLPGARLTPLLPALWLAGWPGPAPGADNAPACADGSAPVDGRCVEPPAEPREALPARVTPFRARSLMPGHVDEPPAAAPRNPAGTPRAVPGSGWGVQIGAFSARSSAARVARQLIDDLGGDFRLAPLERGNRILWACIHGPFPDRASAQAALGRIRSETAHQEAFVKPLDQLELIEPRHASTEE